MKGTRLREMDGKELLEVKISLHGDLCNWFGQEQSDGKGKLPQAAE